MIKYLNLTEFAERIGIERDTLSKYNLPEHDAEVGDRRGWLPSTIDDWNKSRPGRGNWGPKPRGPRTAGIEGTDGMKGIRQQGRSGHVAASRVRKFVRNR